MDSLSRFVAQAGDYEEIDDPSFEKYNHLHDGKTGEFASSDSSGIDTVEALGNKIGSKIKIPKQVGDFSLDTSKLNSGEALQSTYLDGNRNITYLHPNGSQVIFQDVAGKKITTGKMADLLQHQSDIMAKYPIPNATVVIQSGAKVPWSNVAGGVVPKGCDACCFSGDSLGFKNSLDKPATFSEVSRYLKERGMPAPKDINAPYISIRSRVLDVLTKPSVQHTYGRGTFYSGWTAKERSIHLKETVIHEWGHALDKRPNAVSDAQFRNRDPKSTSDYGNTNGREFFAETFTAHELGASAGASPDAVPNYAKAIEYLGIPSLREKVSKADETTGFICYEDFEGGNPYLVTDGVPLESGDDETVEKFNPNHDEKGRFSSGTGMSSSVAESIISRTKANGGLSVRMVSGHEPRHGYMVATSNEFSKIVDEKAFYERKTGIKILADYAKANRSRLIDGKYYLGLWADGGKVYLDVSERVMERAKAERLGQQRNQKEIWDVANGVGISTGGTGVGTDVQKQSSSGGDSREFVEDDGRADRRLGGEGLRQSRPTIVIKFEAGLVPILKFNPYHDAKGRFSTGSGYAQGGYTAEQTYRQNQMKGKGPTKQNLLDILELGALPPLAQKQMLNQFKQIYDVRVNGKDKNGNPATIETNLTDVTVFGGYLKIKGDIKNVKTGDTIGSIERTFTNAGGEPFDINNPPLQVEHDYFAIWKRYPEFQGMGLGKEVIAQSEAYYANIGLNKITVSTAWDGARHWARAGYDFNQAHISDNFRSLLWAGEKLGLTNGNNSTVPHAIVSKFNVLLSRMSPDYKVVNGIGVNSAELINNGPALNFHPMTNKNFPIPNDFAMLGYKKGQGIKDAWVGKVLLDDRHMKYQKIINSEGMNLKTKPVTDRTGDGFLNTGSPRMTPVAPNN